MEDPVGIAEGPGSRRAGQIPSCRRGLRARQLGCTAATQAAERGRSAPSESSVIAPSPFLDRKLPRSHCANLLIQKTLEDERDDGVVLRDRVAAAETPWISRWQMRTQTKDTHM